MAKEKSYGAVVARKNGTLEYLLLKYEAGHWGLVKGHGKRGETEEEAVLRELEEETGITDATFVPGFREAISYFFKARGRTIFKEVAFYLIETHQRDVTISHEHVGFQWLPYESAIKAATFQNTKDVLRKAHDFLKTQR
jgi:bis(5'-nucleosidyl)-tetraphosphatase